MTPTSCSVCSIFSASVCSFLRAVLHSRAHYFFSFFRPTQSLPHTAVTVCCTTNPSPSSRWVMMKKHKIHPVRPIVPLNSQGTNVLGQGSSPTPTPYLCIHLTSIHHSSVTIHNELKVSMDRECRLTKPKPLFPCSSTWDPKKVLWKWNMSWTSQDSWHVPFRSHCFLLPTQIEDWQHIGQIEDWQHIGQCYNNTTSQYEHRRRCHRTSLRSHTMKL